MRAFAESRPLSWIRQPTERLLETPPEPEIGVPFLRAEEPADASQVRALLEASFPGTGEALLVDRLRSDGDLVLSLAAEDAGVVVGYIAFSRLLVEGDVTPRRAVALAPLAVYPEYQRQGVATRLIQESHACLAFLGETLSVVLGEPAYYGRFGYSNKRVAGFESEYQSPYLMALSFGDAPFAGRLVYPAAFRLLGDDATA
jgi:putative acetyltransferase